MSDALTPVQACARARARLARATEGSPLPNGWEWGMGDGRWGVTPYAARLCGGGRVYVDSHGDVNIEHGPAPIFVVAAVLRVYLEACSLGMPRVDVAEAGQ